MIKFNCLIHKETGTVIKYEDWYKSTRDYLRIGEKKFNPRDVLFSDDFEIIYDSEFTLEELEIIFRGNQKYCESLMEKVCKSIGDKEFLKNKYGIEV